MNIGLSDIMYSVITDGADGETYGTPAALAPAMTADISVNATSEAVIYADDGEYDRTPATFKDGKISLGIAELTTDVIAALTGAAVDSKGVLVDAPEDKPVAVAVGFKSLLSDGKYEYTWLYRVIFSSPADKYETKGDSIKYQNPTLDGVIMRRKKADTKGKHPWRVRINTGNSGADATTVSSFFTTVPEPVYTVEV